MFKVFNPEKVDVERTTLLRIQDLSKSREFMLKVSDIVDIFEHQVKFVQCLTFNPEKTLNKFHLYTVKALIFIYTLLKPYRSVEKTPVLNMFIAGEGEIPFEVKTNIL